MKNEVCVLLMENDKGLDTNPKQSLAVFILKMQTHAAICAGSSRGAMAGVARRDRSTLKKKKQFILWLIKSMLFNTMAFTV